MYTIIHSLSSVHQNLRKLFTPCTHNGHTEVTEVVLKSWYRVRLLANLLGGWWVRKSNRRTEKDWRNDLWPGWTFRSWSWEALFNGEPYSTPGL